MSLASSTEPRPIPEHFNEEIQDLHLEYTYDNGWKYEFWIPNHERVVYSIHGGPMSGRVNFQTTYYQRVRENLWQMSWIEETGTIVSIVFDLSEKRITTFMAFSKGHWDFPEEAHGWKQDMIDQWRQLSSIGNATTDNTEPRQAPEHFEEELLDVHLEYTYNNGWKYQFWVPNHERVVYSIHGGPMAGRTNFQTAYYQRIREKLWQMSWVEETGTIVSLVMDLNELRITTFICFSKGHWDFPEKAHGWKQDDLTQWRELSKIGNSTTERHVIPEQAKVDKMYKGRGDLPEIDMNWPTL